MERRPVALRPDIMAEKLTRAIYGLAMAIMTICFILIAVVSLLAFLYFILLVLALSTGITFF